MESMLLGKTEAWYLEGFVQDAQGLRHVLINTLPFRIGRRNDLSFTLPSASISKEHAEIWHDGESLRIRDLGSTNGTFINGVRVLDDRPLREGDLVQLATLEFRLGRHSTSPTGATVETEFGKNVWAITHFEKLFDERGARPFFQPIVALPSKVTVGYEVLARSNLEGLEGASEMFCIAARLNMEGELSRLFRREGVKAGKAMAASSRLFLNTHPTELQEASLIESLQELRRNNPTQRMALEIHEAAITDPAAMQQLRAALRDIEVQLAYDDFGAGQARLIDLIEVPPDYLKFDMSLVHGIHVATRQKQQMLRTLIRMAHDLGVAVVAEGVEFSAEGELCAQLGFDYAQGFFYGRPAPANNLNL